MKTLHEYRFTLKWKNNTPLEFGSLTIKVDEVVTREFVIDLARIGARYWQTVSEMADMPIVSINRTEQRVWFSVLTYKSRSKFNPAPVMSAMENEVYNCSGFVRDIGLKLEPCEYIGSVQVECLHEYVSHSYIPVANTVYELFKCKYCDNTVKREVADSCDDKIQSSTNNITPEKPCISM